MCTGKSRERINAWILVCFLSAFSSLILFRIPCLGNDVAYSGPGLPTYIKNQDIPPLSPSPQSWHAHRSTSGRYFIIKILFPVDSRLLSWQLKIVSTRGLKSTLKGFTRFTAAYCIDIAPLRKLLKFLLYVQNPEGFSPLARETLNISCLA